MSNSEFCHFVFALSWNPLLTFATIFLHPLIFAIHLLVQFSILLFFSTLHPVNMLCDGNIPSAPALVREFWSFRIALMDGIDG